MKDISIEEIQNLLDKTLGVDAAFTAEEEVEAPAVEEITTLTDYTPPAWEAHPDFPDVETRMVDAGWLFEITSLAGLEVQTYQGFTEDNCPIPVPTKPEIYEPNPEQMKALVTTSNTGMIGMHTGHTGTGKTSGIEYFAAVTGRPFHRQECDQFTDDQKLFGSLEMKAGGETYHNVSDLIRAMAFPSIVCIDEANALPSATQMSLNAFMDRKQVRITSHDDSVSETITGYKEFRIALTSNTNGSADDIDLYNTANVQDQAMINRVDLFVTVPYPSEGVERKIIAQLNPDMDKEDVKRMAKFSQLMHRGFESREIGTAFSIRNLIALSKLTSTYTLKEALEVNFLNRLAESDVQDVKETIRGLWG